MKVIVSILPLVLMSAAHAQSSWSVSFVPSPETIQHPAPEVLPKPKPFNRADPAIYSMLFLSRGLDYKSTTDKLAHGAVEGELPTALVKNKPAFLAYSMGLPAAQTLASIVCQKKWPQHANWFRAANIITSGVVFAVAMHNYSVPNTQQTLIKR